jgi:hypothetical protein
LLVAGKFQLSISTLRTMRCRILCSSSLEMIYCFSLVLLQYAAMVLCSYTQDVTLTVVPRYECAINIEDLIKLSDVMSEHSLGPNGGLSIVQESSLLVLFLCLLMLCCWYLCQALCIAWITWRRILTGLKKSWNLLLKVSVDCLSLIQSFGCKTVIEHTRWFPARCCEAVSTIFYLDNAENRVTIISKNHFLD